MENKKTLEAGPEPDAFGYLTMTELSPGLYRGGLLLVDHDGKPKDFRCTSAIRPNAIQKVLYGGTLSGHMALELCGEPLLNAAPEMPGLLLVDDQQLLALRKEAGCPVIWARRQSDLVADTSSGPGCGESRLIASPAGLYDSLLVCGHREYTGDLEAGVPLLEELGSAVDPLEPFERIAAALKLVQEKPGA